MDLHCFYQHGNDSPLLVAMLETLRAFRTKSHATRRRFKGVAPAAAVAACLSKPRRGG